MSARIENRRFRTWEDDVLAPEGHVTRTIIKYGVMRLLRAWHIRLLLVLALLFIIITLGSYSFVITEGGSPQYGSGMDADIFIGAIGFAFLPTCAFLIFVASPLFAEDMRFNAPLFYFSKPVSVSQYTRGKIAVLMLVLTATVLIPLIIFLLLTLVGVAASEPPTVARNGESVQDFGRRVAEWKITHMDTFGDWLYVVAVIVPAVLVFIAFLSAVFVAASAWTQRAWHAAIAAISFLGALTFIGATVMEVSRSAIGDAFGPAGWFNLMVFSPMEWHFSSHIGWSDYTRNWWATYPAAVVISYAWVIGLTIALAFLTNLRIRRMEGAF